MKYLDEFSDPDLARRLLDQIHAVTTRPWAMMEVCGGQTHSIIRHGIDQLLPEGVEMIHGPGCPVCVTPLETIDRALAIARRPEVIFCSFGDMLRVPGSHDDLFTVKSEGGDVRVVYSPLDALQIARDNPDKQVVFFGIGFETTAPANAMTVHQARQQGIPNFSLLVSHVLVPPAIAAIMESPTCRVQAFLAAGHVCSVMGTSEYPPLAEKYAVPIVVTGFEPLDILEGIRRTLVQLEAGRHELENAYPRAVPAEGNPAAMAMLRDVFEVTDRTWRGIGMIPGSGWRLSDRYADYDAELRFEVTDIQTDESPLCRSGEVLQGLIKPHECPAFGKECTPRNPLGATMVSSEGACAAYYTYRRLDLVSAGERVVSPQGGSNDLDFEGWTCPAPLRNTPTVVMGHGGGGAMSGELVESLFLPAYGGAARADLADAAVLPPVSGRLAFSTDSYVVKPMFFPGGSIGDLAVNGTVNDLAMVGAQPLYLSTAYILAEGTPMSDIGRVAMAVGKAAEQAGVQLVTGDTKVVDHGSGDGIYVNTAGVGVIPDGVEIGPERARPGDAVLVSGAIGVHGVAVMSCREGLEFTTPVESDSAPLHGLVADMLATGADVRVLRDPTRGGVSASLNEIARASGVGMDLVERDLPVPEEVRDACGLLGLDPLQVANEGKLVAIVPAADVDAVLEAMRAHRFGSGACRIGTVVEDHPRMVVARTGLGGTRVIDLPLGEQLPRIC